ncbi:preprotein translocase subunit SecY, partial [Candidatus Woesearchaeota archaeon CG_4_10_14_0_8_um_filter_47_5]
MNSFITNFLQNLPEVKGPTQKRLPFSEKLRWTVIILVLYYVLSAIPLYGQSGGSLRQFEFLSIVLGADFGSILSLGIGPLVTSSIVLQLLVGAGLLKIDLTKPEGKRFFQGLQKFLSIFFVIFEACIYVFMGGLPPSVAPGTSTYVFHQFLIIFQLFLGG